MRITCFLSFCFMYVRILWSGHYPSRGPQHSRGRAEHLQFILGPAEQQQEVLPERPLDGGLAGQALHRRDGVWLQETLQ